MRQPQHPVSPAVTSPRPGPALTVHANPLRLLVSSSLWRSAGFLLTYLLLSGAGFALVFASGLTTAVLALTVALAPLLTGAAAVVRGCAHGQRFLLRQATRGPVRSCYPRPAGPGLWRRARGEWTSGATWRETGYLAGLWPVLFALDTAVVAVWAVLAAGVTAPLWYSRVSDWCVAGTCGGQGVPGLQFGNFPHGPLGPGAHGFYVDSPGRALLLAACCAVAFLAWNYLVVLTARLHATVALALLARTPDPLGPARDVMAGPGPLGPLLGQAPGEDSLPLAPGAGGMGAQGTGGLA